MVNKVITVETGKITEYLHHVDLNEFGINKVLSSFIGVFDDGVIIFDCGSSYEVKRLLRYLKKNNISLSSVKYLSTSHHHFDHNGGLWKLFGEIKKHNPEVKILTNQKTKELLNDFEGHLNRARRTYGEFVGSMRPIEEDGFELIEPIAEFENGLESISPIKEFTIKDNKIKLFILKTPGHTPDHQSSLFIKNGEIDFIFFGEAVGTLYNSNELLTTPTSMPAYFNYKNYMQTVSKLKFLSANNAGFGHFGVIHGKENVKEIMQDHETFMMEFRDKIITYYKEKPETRYIVEKIIPYYMDRTDITDRNHPYISKIVLGLVYGMLIDLGYRSP